MMRSKQLFSADIAALRDISQSRARAWLADLEQKYGSKVVGRVGNRRYVTEDSLSAIGPNWASSFDKCNARVTELSNRVQELEKRLEYVEKHYMRARP